MEELAAWSEQNNLSTRDLEIMLLNLKTIYQERKEFNSNIMNCLKFLLLT